jgi:hypothetical protein
VQQPGPEKTDAGVGEEALLSVQNLPTAGIPAAALAREMPKQPFPGQRKPPCERPEKVINGGCWVGVVDEKPPCGQRMFDFADRCYIPAYTIPRPPTSEEP